MLSQKRKMFLPKIIAASYLTVILKQLVSFSISTCKVQKRKANPFSDDISLRSMIVRGNETYKACSLISGGGGERERNLYYRECWI